VVLTGRVLVDGTGAGPLLRLAEPLSFWGGIDPMTGTIIDVRHPQHGVSITGTVLALPAARGSSSSSSVLLELVAQGKAPAAILLGESDAILALGAVIAREMGWTPPPVLELSPADQARLPAMVMIEAGGRIGPARPPS
jgi:predicted aconitase with swiveling domain